MPNKKGGNKDDLFMDLYAYSSAPQENKDKIAETLDKILKKGELHPKDRGENNSKDKGLKK